MVTSPHSISAEEGRVNLTSPSNPGAVSRDSFKRSAPSQPVRTAIRPMPTMEEKAEPADVRLPNSPPLSLSPTPPSTRTISSSAISPPPLINPHQAHSPPPITSRPSISGASRSRPISTTSSSVVSSLPSPTHQQAPSNSFVSASDRNSNSPPYGKESSGRKSLSEDRFSKPMPAVPAVATAPAAGNSRGNDDLTSTPGALYYIQQQQDKEEPALARPPVSSDTESDEDEEEAEEEANDRPASALPGRNAIGPGPVLNRKPSGARAQLPVTRRFAENPSPSPSPGHPSQPSRATMPTSTNDTNDEDATQTSHAADSSLEDQAADALAALNFLEQGNSPPRIPTVAEKAPQKQAVPPPIPEVIEPDDRAPSPPSNQYRSSFAPSKQAAERKAKLQAQQAAHHEAVHKPGKPNGKVTKPKDRGAWGASSDEEEEEEAEEEDEDVDSDDNRQMPSSSKLGHGPPPALVAGPRAPIPQASLHPSQFREPSPSTMDLQQQYHQRMSRVLPQIPDRRSPGQFISDYH